MGSAGKSRTARTQVAASIASPGEAVLPPSAAAQITGAVNLPLFLLEGVAILAEVFTLLVLLLGAKA